MSTQPEGEATEDQDKKDGEVAPDSQPQTAGTDEPNEKTDQ